MSNFFGDVDENNPPVIAGDYGDDDATYVDLLVQEAPALDVSELPHEEDRIGNVGIKIPNRLITRTYNFTGPMTRPILGLPADVNRKTVQILIDSAYFWLASEPHFMPGTDGTTNLDQPNYGFAALVGANVEIRDYTGPLYFINGASTGAASKCRIIFIAVSE